MFSRRYTPMAVPLFVSLRPEGMAFETLGGGGGGLGWGLGCCLTVSVPRVTCMLSVQQTVSAAVISFHDGDCIHTGRDCSSILRETRYNATVRYIKS